MNKSRQVQIIREAFQELPDLQDGWKDVKGFLFDLNREAEKRHRRGTSAGCVNALSVNDAAKLFVCSHLLDGWKQPDKWGVDAILDIRNEVLYAQAYAKKFHAKLKDWFEAWSVPFEGVDYAELMKGGRQ